MQDRYLVQFLKAERDPRGYWVTDCAFQEGQLDRAIAYINRVLQSPKTRTASGLVLDNSNPGLVIYRADMFPTEGKRI